QVDERGLQPGVAEQVFQRDHLVGFLFEKPDGERGAQRVDVSAHTSPLCDTPDGSPDDLVRSFTWSPHRRRAAIRDQVRVWRIPHAGRLRLTQDLEILVGDWLRERLATLLADAHRAAN